MPKTLQDFQVGVANRIQDGAGKLSQAGIDECIAEAIAGRYTSARPLTKLKDFAGDSATYEWALDSTNFPGWVDEASAIVALEYPAGERVPVYLEGNEWIAVRTSATVEKLRLLTTTPQTGKTLRVTYSVPHTETGTTVNDKDFHAVCNLAASLACRRLQAIYSQMLNSAMSADHADYGSKSQEYARLAKQYESAFEEGVGIGGESKQPGATGWVTMQDPDDEERLTH